MALAEVHLSATTNPSIPTFVFRKGGTGGNHRRTDRVTLGYVSGDDLPLEFVRSFPLLGFLTLLGSIASVSAESVQTRITMDKGSSVQNIFSEKL